MHGRISWPQFSLRSWLCECSIGHAHHTVNRNIDKIQNLHISDLLINKFTCNLMGRLLTRDSVHEKPAMWWRSNPLLVLIISVHNPHWGNPSNCAVYPHHLGNLIIEAIAGHRFHQEHASIYLFIQLFNACMVMAKLSETRTEYWP